MHLNFRSPTPLNPEAQYISKALKEFYDPRLNPKQNPHHVESRLLRIKIFL